MRFRCSIPTSKRAFEIPGTRSDLRVSFDIPESEILESLRMITLRGAIFELEVIQVKHEKIEEIEKEIEESLITVWAMISPRANAIRFDGEAGMSLTLSFPSVNENLFAMFLRLREHELILNVNEESYKKV